VIDMEISMYETRTLATWLNSAKPEDRPAIAAELAERGYPTQAAIGGNYREYLAEEAAAR
jgi:hypothetical protein